MTILTFDKTRLVRSEWKDGLLYKTFSDNSMLVYDAEGRPVFKRDAVSSYLVPESDNPSEKVVSINSSAKTTEPPEA